MMVAGARSSFGSTEASIQSCVLYVGGLSETVSDANLGELLSPFGRVAHAMIVRHKHSGRSAGYGFAQMDSPAEALAAAKTLEGTTHDGRRLRLYVTQHVLHHPSQTACPVQEPL